MNEIDKTTFDWWQNKIDTIAQPTIEETFRKMKGLVNACQPEPEGEFFDYNGNLCFRKFDKKVDSLFVNVIKRFKEFLKGKPTGKFSVTFNVNEGGVRGRPKISTVDDL